MSAQVVLITGASSGIGRAAAHQAASAGDHVVLVARGPAALAEVEAECLKAGAASVTVETVDVGDDQAVAKCVQRTIQELGTLDAVLHCAGVVAYGRTEEVPVEVFDGVLRTNLTGSVNVARHVLPVLREQGHGSLVFVGSVIGHIAVPSMSAYVLSKYGVRALARQVQLENRDVPGVTISYVAPGGVDTPIYLQAANFAGFVGRPPPPVVAPERVAREMLQRVGRRNARSQVGLANDVMRLGFAVLPGVFDVLVGPLFRLAAVDRTHPVPPNEGNVLESRPEDNRLYGNQGNALVGIGRNAAAVVRSLGRTPRS